MKLHWRSAVALVLGGAALMGSATHTAAQQEGGLTVQQMTSAPEPRASNWRFPKISLPKFKDRKKPSSDSLQMERNTAPRSGKSEKTGDPIAMARLYEKRGQLDAAVKLYEQELSENPKNGMVHHRLAVISSRDNNWAKARKHFDAALELTPDHSELLSDLGYALYLQHQLADAEAALKAAIQANPRNLAAHNNLGIVLGVQGRFDESLAEFRQVGGEADAYANLAYVHTQLGDVEQAMVNLNHALSHNPNLRPAAVALVQLNDLKQRMKQQRDVSLASHEPTPAKLLPASEPRLAPEAPVDLAPIVSAANLKRPTTPATASEASVQPSAGQPSTGIVEVPLRSVEKPTLPEGLPSARPAIPAIAAPSQSRGAITTAPVVLRPTSQATIENSGREDEAPQTPTAGGLTILKAVPLASKADSQSRPESSVTPTAPPPASKPVVPALGLPAESSVAEAEKPRLIANTAPELVQAPPLLVSNSHLNAGQAPVISPSRAMQELREKQQVTALPESKPLENPFVKPISAQSPSATNMDAAATALEREAAPALFPSGATIAEMNGVALTQYAEAIQPSTLKNETGPTSGSPVFSAAAKLPGPMDQLPREAQLLQMSTSKLHPTAQPTWSAQDRPIARPAEQPTMKSAHFFDWTGKVSP